jgi:hypothetical protein
VIFYTRLTFVKINESFKYKFFNITRSDAISAGSSRPASQEKTLQPLMYILHFWLVFKLIASNNRR